MTIHDSAYARYITVGVVLCLIALGIYWIFQMQPKHDGNIDPKKGRVCFDADCRVSKQCDAKTLVISTTVPGLRELSVQRVPKSSECV